MSASDRAIQFIGKFLQWYQGSFGQPDVVNHIKLVELVKEAEDIHVLRVKEIEAALDREKELKDFMYLAKEEHENEEVSNLTTLTKKKHDARRTKSGSVPPRKKQKKISKYL